MDKIGAQAKSVSDLLSNKKYLIDYYQREYKWKKEQITELMEDLGAKFLENYEVGHEYYQVQQYKHYFLGSIIISEHDTHKFIIDGQQRLTSLTLLLMFLNNLQKQRSDGHKVNLDALIYSDVFGKKSFNIVVDEHFPESLRTGSLIHFIYWLISNVDLIEIKTGSDDEAYTIFETMNDRGLRLSFADMLKGYLLANVLDPTDRVKANDLWKKRLLELLALQDNAEEDFFKTWLRAKYADTIREGKKGAVNKDFEKIGAFRKWVREEKDRIGLRRSEDFRDFVMSRFNRFANHYIRIRQAAQKLTPGLEYIFYNSHNNFTLQYPLLLAPLCIDDDQETMNRKMRLVAGYLDIFIARRAVNFRTLNYSSIVYTMFNLMKDIRDLDLLSLAAVLERKVSEMQETFAGVNSFFLHMQNRHYVHHILARITHHIEQQSGIESDFYTYVSRENKKPFEIEHIWAYKYERHLDEFASEREFNDYRNRLGGLVLLPRGFNQSFGDKPYHEKVDAYFGQNLLVKSLNEQCYYNNPSFLAYKNCSRLPFRSHSTFKKADLDARQQLYRLVCEEIWSPARFDKELL